MDADWVIAEWERQYNEMQRRACEAEAEVKRLRAVLGRISDIAERALGRVGWTGDE
jgi:hypothetical protein